MKRVVITGAGGFVGSRLVQHYRDIWDITPLDHSRLELTDREAVHAALAGAAPQLVIHTAALADTGYCENHPLESFEVNLQARGGARRAGGGCAPAGHPHRRAGGHRLLRKSPAGEL